MHVCDACMSPIFSCADQVPSSTSRAAQAYQTASSPQRVSRPPPPPQPQQQQNHMQQRGLLASLMNLPIVAITGSFGLLFGVIGLSASAAAYIGSRILPAPWYSRIRGMLYTVEPNAHARQHLPAASCVVQLHLHVGYYSRASVISRAHFSSNNLSVTQHECEHVACRRHSGSHTGGEASGPCGSIRVLQAGLCEGLWGRGPPVAHDRLAGGHGQGSWAVQVPVCVSAFALPPGTASGPVHLQPVTFLNAALLSLHNE